MSKILKNYNQNTMQRCVDVAVDFINSQKDHMPLILVPIEIYKKSLKGVNGYVPAECPEFKIKAYKGKNIIAIPDNSNLDKDYIYEN